MKKIMKYSPLFAALVVINAQAASVALSGSDASGYLAFSGYNNEFGGPDNYGGAEKNFQYPYFYNPNKGYWEVIVAEKLSADASYAQEAEFEVLGKTITDADFAEFNVGSINYDEALLSGIGTENIAVEDLSLAIDTADFDPINGERNANATVANEFAWTYTIAASNLTGGGLTFTDGVLTNIDLQADLAVEVLLNNLPTLALDWDTDGNGVYGDDLTQAASLSISGNQLAFNFDQITDGDSFFGSFEDARLAITRAGTIDAVAVSEVPVPAAAWLFMSALSGLVAVGRQRKNK